MKILGFLCLLVGASCTAGLWAALKFCLLFLQGFWSLDSKLVGQNCGDSGRWWNRGDSAEDDELPEAALHNDHGMCSTMCLFSASSYIEVVLNGYLLLLLLSCYLPSIIFPAPSLICDGVYYTPAFLKCCRCGCFTTKSESSCLGCAVAGMERQEWERRAHNPVHVTVPGAPWSGWHFLSVFFAFSLRTFTLATGQKHTRTWWGGSMRGEWLRVQRIWAVCPRKAPGTALGIPDGKHSTGLHWNRPSLGAALTQLWLAVNTLCLEWIQTSHQRVVLVFSLSFLCLLRFILSLASCKTCLVIDDQLNILPISSHAANITPVPPQSQVSEGSQPFFLAEILLSWPWGVKNLFFF